MGGGRKEGDGGEEAKWKERRRNKEIKKGEEGGEGRGEVREGEAGKDSSEEGGQPEHQM